jgi:hypothetical protein
VPDAMEEDEAADPLEVCLLRAVAVVAQTERLSDSVQQLRLSRLAVAHARGLRGRRRTIRIRPRSWLDRLFDAPCCLLGPRVVRHAIRGTRNIEPRDAIGSGRQTASARGRQHRRTHPRPPAGCGRARGRAAGSSSTLRPGLMSGHAAGATLGGWACPRSWRRGRREAGRAARRAGPAPQDPAVRPDHAAFPDRLIAAAIR